MCGKFTQLASWQEVHAFSQPLVVGTADEAVVSTPMRFAKIMRLSKSASRELVLMRWGFAAKDEQTPSRPRHMHARCETIDIKPTFARSFAHCRGILMVHTFNEGEEVASGRIRQWVVTPNDGQPIAIAVIYETWQNGNEALETFVQVTTPANALISQITDRMPAILPREAWPAWLGETGASLGEIKALLHPYEAKGAWTMVVQQPSRPTKSKDPSPRQSLF